MDLDNIDLGRWGVNSDVNHNNKNSKATHIYQSCFGIKPNILFEWMFQYHEEQYLVVDIVREFMSLPRCKNLTRFSLFVNFCFTVRYCLKCFCFLCSTSSVSFTGSYTEVKPNLSIKQFLFTNYNYTSNTKHPSFVGKHYNSPVHS